MRDGEGEGALRRVAFEEERRERCGGRPVVATRRLTEPAVGPLPALDPAARRRVAAESQSGEHGRLDLGRTATARRKASVGRAPRQQRPQVISVNAGAHHRNRAGSYGCRSASKGSSIPRRRYSAALDDRGSKRR